MIKIWPDHLGQPLYRKKSSFRLVNITQYTIFWIALMLLKTCFNDKSCFSTSITSVISQKLDIHTYNVMLNWFFGYLFAYCILGSEKVHFYDISSELHLLPRELSTLKSQYSTRSGTRKTRQYFKIYRSLKTHYNSKNSTGDVNQCLCTWCGLIHEAFYAFRTL